MAAHKTDISVVLPVFNEALTLRELHREILSAVEPMGRSFEVIYCDDGSTDGSLAELGAIAAEDSRVRVISFARNYGQTAALDACFRAATGAIVVPMDADLQNDPADIPKLIARVEAGADVASGWRVNRQDAFLTKVFPSRIANGLVSRVTGVPLHDYGCTLKAYRASVLADFRLYGEMHRLIPAYAKWAGGKVVEEPVNHRPRRAGRSKYTLTKSVRLVLDLFTVRFLLQYSTKPMYFIGKWALAAIGLGTASFAWTVAKRLLWGQPLYTDPFFLVGLFLVLSGFQFLAVGLLAELAMRNYHESCGKPPYLVRTRINARDGERPDVPAEGPAPCAESPDS